MPIKRDIDQPPGPAIFQPAEILDFAAAGRLPEPGDNCAIAIRTLPAGTLIRVGNRPVVISQTILEGHRFVIQPVAAHFPLTSWNRIFGKASRAIAPGEYVCNEKILKALSARNLDFELPPSPNFTDARHEFKLDEAGFQPADPTPLYASRRTFRGYYRSPGRGAGTRNYFVILGTSARAGAFARQLARRFAQSASANLDGVVAVEHTEGETDARNLELTLRTLAGFATHPNVGGLLLVDYGTEPISNRALLRWLGEHHYDTAALALESFTIGSGFESSLEEAESVVRKTLPLVSAQTRTELPLEHLRLGLQCGGSDAFSGISANPLVGILARETVRSGGSANLAETDELIGAEAYVLSKVRDLATARAFLEKVRRFNEWAGWHGHSAEGNPSGGNMFRGLYNITIKSLGAARKKDPSTRLDYVIDFAQPMKAPGFYFMDSPGNDLESIAGQAGSGCNLILFATGNGSITNFPFIPTIKVMTTTRRFELVRNEMDFNAGRYLDGETLEGLGAEAFEQLLRVASGEKSAGEKAHHAQVQLWREWRQDSPKPRGHASPLLNGKPLVSAGSSEPEIAAPAPDTALVLPTSLCSGQIASMIATRLQQTGQVKRATALPHTEGCGNAAGDAEELFLRTMASYLAHPRVSKALLLEHGCEKTHNDAFRHLLNQLGIDPAKYGYASIQLDGGIEKVTTKALNYLNEHTATSARIPRSITIGLIIISEPPTSVVESFGQLQTRLLQAGSTVVIPQNFPAQLAAAEPTLGCAQRFSQSGLHLMEMPGQNPLETITALGGTGVDCILIYCDEKVLPGNPLVPTGQICSRSAPAPVRADCDLVLAPGPAEPQLFALLEQFGSGVPSRNQRLGNTAFQVTRGYFGISL